MNIITRKHLALHLHDLLELPFDYHAKPRLGRKIVRAITKSIQDALKRGEDVHIQGFGTFKIVTQSPRRTGNNIIYGRRKSAIFSSAPMEHPAKKKVVFKPSTTLMAMLNLDGNVDWDGRLLLRNWSCE